MLPRRLTFGLSAAAIAAAIAVSACDDVTVLAADPATVEVNPGSLTIEIAQTGTLQAVIKDAGGTVLSGHDIAWSLSEPTVASVDADGLVTGLAEGTTTIAASTGAAGGSAQVVVESLPGFALDRSAVSLSAIAGAATGTEAVSISGTGTNPATGLNTFISYQSGDGWLQAALSSTSTPASLQLNAATQGLAHGQYVADVTVRADRVPSQSVRVTLSVLAPPSIGLSANSVDLSTNSGLADPVTQVIQVTNTGAGSINGLFAAVIYGAGQPGNWLATQLSSGSAPSQLTVSASAASLLQGTYTAIVRVQSGDAANSPQAIQVTFVVEP